MRGGHAYAGKILRQAGGKTKKCPSNDLLSRTVASIVPSALRGLTTVFGMGTGVALSLTSLEQKENNYIMKDTFIL